jgi:ABC-type transport system involved in cytochrome c biogenesis permease subunit
MYKVQRVLNLKSSFLLFILFLGMPALAFTQQQISDKISDLAYVFIPMGIVVGAFMLYTKINKDKK